jgi:phosphopantothenoylcysteine decarboxylase/phosphopantothenate--cysteine ligase
VTRARAGLVFWVTGGGTREPVDDVRWLGNASTGRMACELARVAARRGHRVTLFLARHATPPRSPRVRVVPFTTAAELRARLLAARPAPDAVLHAAAVSDYAPVAARGKVRSGQARWTVELRPLPKVVDALRRRHRRALICLFKLESRVTPRELERRALAAARRAGAQLVFANRLEDVGAEHRGLLVDRSSGAVQELRSRASAARAIVRACERRIAAP